jgi:type IV pilus assembly protein PilX
MKKDKGMNPLLTPFRAAHRACGFRQQRGISLLFALLALVALSLATLALVRSVDTGTMLMGNIGFKQDVTATADQGTRQAIEWLNVNAASLNTDAADGQGYYASTTDLVDVTGRQMLTDSTRALVNWDWDNASLKDCSAATDGSFASCSLKPATGTAVTGNSNSTRFIIFRMCSQAGDSAASTNNCAKPVANSSSSATKKGELNYSDPLRFSGTSGPYYRIIVRAKGARDTTSFTETIVHF